MTAGDLEELRCDEARMEALRTAAQSILAALDRLANEGARTAGGDLLLQSNILATLLRAQSLEGPFQG
ncbi:MAG: hypothetical protein BGO06_07990 [Shinella sp. 65-6]|nr:MAG: hypothetical protein BGO06_07990 [Shinella sp. 65-6]